MLLSEVVATAATRGGDVVTAGQGRGARRPAPPARARGGGPHGRASSSVAPGRAGSASATATVSRPHGGAGRDAEPHRGRPRPASSTTSSPRPEPGPPPPRQDTLQTLGRRATADEQQLRDPRALGEMRTGALEGVLLDAVAKASEGPVAAVRRAAMLCGDLGETARLALTGGADDLEAGRARRRNARCCRCSPSTAADPAAALAITGEASVEYKLDGARIQVHRDGDDVRVFTRNLADDHPPRARGRRGRARTCPVARRHPRRRDALARRGRRPAPVPGHDVAVRRGGAARARVLHPWFFDVLHVDGARPHRRAAQRAAADARDASSARSPDPRRGHRRPGRRRPRLPRRARGRARGRRRQGDRLAVCGRAGAARAGSRSSRCTPTTSSCSRVEWGSGRRTGWLSNLHLGALDPTGEFGEPGGFVMVGKTFKGLTDELLRWQTEHFPTIETRSHRARRLRRAGHRRRDRHRRRAAVQPLPGRHRAAVRPRQALPRRQAPRRRRHHPDPPHDAAHQLGMRVSGAASATRRPAG